jgi:hypothetical protein
MFDIKTCIRISATAESGGGGVSGGNPKEILDSPEKANEALF